jgi:GT2 family glycosyltransferase
VKFEQKWPDAKSGDQFKLEESVVTKKDKLGTCKMCHAITRWFDLTFQCHICCDGCMDQMWSGFNEYKKPRDTYHEQRHKAIKEEMDTAQLAKDASKDILIVVHNQLDYLKETLESVVEHTKNYNLFIWDNGSDKETYDFLQDKLKEFDPNNAGECKTFEVIHSDKNIGFIEPNNTLVDFGDGEYIILLNSDVHVYDGWTEAMLGWLQKHEDCGIVGYIGGLLDEEFKGDSGDHGWEVDYVSGWCLCMPRAIYQKHGLFNKQLKFAYCEDADLCLRIKENGLRIYALYAPLVHHYGNKTIKAVHEKGEINVTETFEANHEYMKVRWKNYLENDRIALRKPVPKLTDRNVF